METTHTNGTNGTAPKSKLQQIKDAYAAAGSPAPTAEVKTAAVEAWKAANKAVTRAEAALANAQSKVYDASEGLATLFGGRQMRIEGVLYEVSGNKDKIFLRSKAPSDDVVEL